MKITNWHRTMIIDAAAHAAFAKREAELDAAIARIGDRAYMKLFSAKLRRQMDELGDFFVTSEDSCNFNYAPTPAAEELARVNFKFSKPHRVPRALWNSYNGVPVEADAIKPFVEDRSNRLYLKKRLKEERQEFCKQVSALVYNVTTAKKLFEVWPEVRELMPAPFWEDSVPKNLPAINVAVLNQAIAAGKPVPEAVAA